VAERPQIKALREPGDPLAKARLAGRYGAEALVRLYPIYRAFEQAAAAEPELREAWRDYQRRRRTDVRQLVQAMADAGELRSGLSVERATDTLWALIGWHPVALLVEELGWSRAQIARWLEDLLVTLITGPAPTAKR
jgi:hypothetical protein